MRRHAAVGASHEEADSVVIYSKRIPTVRYNPNHEEDCLDPVLFDGWRLRGRLPWPPANLLEWISGAPPNPKVGKLRSSLRRSGGDSCAPVAVWQQEATLS
jgi:hypothetical protein